jgi:DNA-directed RNA polymerase III subunit RPC1
MQRRFMKALEDLSIKYDQTVRMSTEHIVQFTYGDDGLDPMFMDDNNQPVSLHRLFTIIKERTKSTHLVKNENLMTPDEIIENLDLAIKECHISNISRKFKEQFREFVQSNLINEIKRVRESFGMRTENIPPRELAAERKDKFL